MAVLALNLAVSRVDPRDVGGEGGYYCYACEAEVLQGSKHCRTCIKCVEEFDHHCKWLNTCIGARKYQGFLSLLVTLTVHLALEAALAAHAAALAFARRDAALDSMLAQLPAPIGAEAYRSTMLALLLAALAAMYAVGELLLFHVVLKRKRLTTYQFIMAAKDLKAGDLECQGVCKESKAVAAKIHATGLPAALDDGGGERSLKELERGETNGGEKQGRKKNLVKLNICTLIRFTRTSDYGVGSPGPNLALVPLEGTPTKGKLAP